MVEGKSLSGWVQERLREEELRTKKYRTQIYPGILLLLGVVMRDVESEERLMKTGVVTACRHAAAAA